MEDIKREMTIEELEAELKRASETYKAINKRLREKKEAEEHEHNQKLEKEKISRENEIYAALDKTEDLLKKFMSDYETIRINKMYHYLNFIFGKRYPFWF